MVSDDSSSITKSSQNPINTTNSSQAKHLSRLSNNSDNTLYLGKRITDKGELEGDVRDYKWLEGKIHRDDEDLQRYITERVYVDKRSRNILGERNLLLKDGRKHKSRDLSPIHVQSLVDMTNQYDAELSSNQMQNRISALLCTSA